MVLRYLLASVPGSPYVVTERCIWSMLRTYTTPLRTAIQSRAMNYGSAAHRIGPTASSRHSPLMSLGQSYLSRWYCVTKRSCSGTQSCADRKMTCSAAAVARSPIYAYVHHRPFWWAAPARFQSTSSYVVAKDVVLFEHDRTRFFRLLSFFCAGQLLFWTYLAHFAFTNLRETRRPPPGENTKIRAGLFGLEANLGSNTWRYGFTITCLAIGGVIVGLGVLFCRRSVSQVILHKGGTKVTVRTQSPLGATRGQSLTVSLAQVASFAHRQESPNFIPLRVKGHRFYFLLDKEGTINNPKLFDVTVGAYRPF
ncbi:hypothetical protein GJAV_G00126930 [Gymnothorax javanicus]|nr:hypothetical protein GJAV_G00126930 [Gymnothorax javanicus]